MTHNEKVTLVGVLLTGFGMAVGWALSWWSQRGARCDACYKDGRGDAVDEAFRRVSRGMVLRLSPENVPAWCDAGSQWDIGGASASVAFDERAEQDAGAGRVSGAHGEDSRSGVQVPDSLPEPAPARTIYRELAALAADDVPRPDPPLGGAGHTYTMSDHWHFMADWRTEAVSEAHAFDDWLPGYLEEFRRGLTPGWVAAYQLLEA